MALIATGARGDESDSGGKSDRLAGEPGLPVGLRATLPRVLSRYGEPRPALAREVLVTPDGLSLYAVPVGEGLCAVVTDGQGGGASCDPFGSLHAGCSGGGGEEPPACSRQFVYGVVSEGSRRATAKLEDGGIAETSAAGGVYLLELPAGARVDRVDFAP